MKVEKWEGGEMKIEIGEIKFMKIFHNGACVAKPFTFLCFAFQNKFDKVRV